MTNARGTKNPAITSAPQTVSVTFKKGKKYPVDIKPVMNGAIDSSGGGGVTKKKLNPNTK